MPYPLTDGGAIGIYNITKSLAKRGHEITLVTYPLDTDAETQLAIRELSQFAKVVTTSKPLPPRWRVLLSTLFRGAYPIERRITPEMFELLDRTVRAEQFDLVHVDHAHMGRYGLWLIEKFGLPIVLREHNFEAQIYQRFAETESNPLKKFLARIHGARLREEEISFLKAFDAIAPISDEDLRLMREVAPNARYRVIPAGVDTDYFQPSVFEVVPETILSVGSFAWDPNFDAMKYFLREVFPLVLAKRPNARLQIIGACGERILPFAAPFGKSVQVLGLVPDIRDYLSRSAVLVVPLRIGGGMRLKLLEFFAAGKAVVSTSIGAEGNLAADGVHLLIRNGKDAFAAGILELLKNPDLRASLGKSARDLVTTEYSWDRIASEFESLYEEVTASRV